MPLEAAERWCDAWELDAADRGLAKGRDYWELGQEWIGEKRTHGR
jgi:hypothetical protein